MKTFDDLFDDVIKYEGYYSNVPGDRGGETYMGIARNLHSKWSGWTIVDKYKTKVGTIKRNTKINDTKLTQSVKDFYKENFYNKYNIGVIKNGSLQEIIFDWCVNSGNWGSIGVQKVLNKCFGFNLKVDGVLGNVSVAAINSCDPNKLFEAIKEDRISFYKAISKRGQNIKFLGGWLNRINSITFE